ncbi:hypothetical protein SDC9_104361 [bioreactor metagenome]|uniref:Uncharacterized protein n=1 Tax=bioreactor metagenome TaxID=1076179 RepID=A0A645AWR0_9ZZZZ
MRFNLTLDRLKFLHEFFVNMQSSSRIQKDIIITVVFSNFQCFSCNIHRIGCPHFKNRNTCIRSHDLQLLNCRRSVNITGNQQRSVPLIFKHQRNFGTVCGFTGALQAAHHHHCRGMRCRIQTGFGAAHKLRQFFVDDFNNHLTRGQTFHHLSANRSFRDFIGEILCHFIVDVGFQKCQTHFTHRIFDIGFSKTAFAF